MYDLGIINGEVYVNGNFIKSNVYIRNGIIERIHDNLLFCKESYNAKNKKILPGFIDPHVHFALGGGQYTSSDDFYSGSVSAAYGGITTYIDFLDPINKAIDLEEAFIKRKELASHSVIDYGFHVTVKNPKHEVNKILGEMERLNLHRVKLFTTYSDSNRRTYDEEIIELLKYSRDHKLLVLAHIEDDEQIELNDSYKTRELLLSRPSSAETDEAIRLAGMVRETGGKLYMVHCSSGETVEQLKEKYKDIINKDFYIESCPHYFVLDENIWDRNDGYLYTMAPPLRSQKERESLIAGIDNIYTIGTDHCPFMKVEKDKSYLKDIPMGVGGVEHSFAVMYSLFHNKAIDKMTINPAKIHGLYPKKGIIREGSDGDLVIIEEKERVIHKDHSKCDYTIYDNYKVDTRILSTIVRGNFVIKDGEYIENLGEYIEG